METVRKVDDLVVNIASASKEQSDGIGQVICSHLKQWHQNAEFCSRESSKRKFPATRTICRHERLGGLLNYYYGEAA